MRPSQTDASDDSSAKRILIVDDDVELCELVGQYLKSQGFQIEAVHDGSLGLERSLSGTYSLIILDVMLPGIRGFEVLRRVRAKSAVPIIMLTAHGDDVDRIVGLGIGADDYLPKPFNPRELAARIQAVLRRSTQISTTVSEPIVLGDVELEESARIARCGSRELELTSLEFDILAVLLKRSGQVVTREELVKTLLGRELAPLDRSIDVHISNLRKKLGPYPDGANRIRNIRRVGYIYAVPGMPKEE